MQIVKLKTRYLVNLELEADRRKRRACAWLASIGLTLGGLLVLLLTGCTTPGTGSNPMTIAAFTTAVSLGEGFALEMHPEITPYIKAAADVVCATANGTNVSPDNIVAALNAANITNDTARLVVNGSIAIYDTVFTLIGTNGIASQPVLQGYAKALCEGMRNGIPPTASAMRRVTVGKHAPSEIKAPHLR